MLRINHFRRYLILAALGLFLMPSFTWAATYKVDPDHTTVSFKVRHLFSKVQGLFNKFEGTIDYEPGKPETWKTNGTVDVVLALLLILGGVVGAPIGSRLAAKLPGVVLRALMSVLILLVAVELLTELLRTPVSPFSLGIREVQP